VHPDKAGLPTPAFGRLTLWVLVGGKMRRKKADGTTRNDKGIPFFDPDLAKIFNERLPLKIDRIIEKLFYHGYKISEKDVPGLIDEIIKNMISALFNEMERYGKSSQNKGYGYKKDIERARKGNNESLFRLIAWNKGWLFIDWVKNRIIQAQEEMDTEFFKSLGEAVKAEPKVQPPIHAEDKEDRKLIISTMEAAIPYYLSKSPPGSRQKIINRFIKELFNALGDKEPWEGKPFTTDIDYFRRYIKERHLSINFDND